MTKGGTARGPQLLGQPSVTEVSPMSWGRREIVTVPLMFWAVAVSPVTVPGETLKLVG